MWKYLVEWMNLTSFCSEMAAIGGLRVWPQRNSHRRRRRATERVRPSVDHGDIFGGQTAVVRRTRHLQVGNKTIENPSERLGWVPSC